MVSAAAEEVFSVLADLSSYKEWWPRSIQFQIDDTGTAKVGTRMRISNQGAVRWVAEVTAIEPNRRIAFRYGEGAWDGTAEWTLTREAGGVRVRYAVDIVPVPFLIRVLGRFVDLGAKHSARMQRVLERLKTRVARPR